MAFQSAMNGLMAKGGGMDPNAASLGTGPPPQMPGIPPPPTNIGAMPTGMTTGDKKSAGNDAITALRSFQSFAPSMQGDVDAIIAKIKDAVKSEAQAPAPGQPIPTGAPVNPEPVMDSGGAGM